MKDSGMRIKCSWSSSSLFCGMEFFFPSSVLERYYVLKGKKKASWLALYNQNTKFSHSKIRLNCLHAEGAKRACVQDIRHADEWHCLWKVEILASKILNRRYTSAVRLRRLGAPHQSSWIIQCMYSMILGYRYHTLPLLCLLPHCQLLF